MASLNKFFGLLVWAVALVNLVGPAARANVDSEAPADLGGDTFLTIPGEQWKLM